LSEELSAAGQRASGPFLKGETHGMSANVAPLPNLPCPACGANILQEGFHNTCTEYVSLRENNYAVISDGRLYVRHDGENYEPIGHECSVYVYCSSCAKLLPWPLYKIRELDGTFLAGINRAIAALIEEAQGKLPDA
jgi:hypothetical protein